MEIRKKVAAWAKLDARFISQLFVGIFSLMFPRQVKLSQNDRIMKFFERHYINNFDQLVFDSNENGYTDEICEWIKKNGSDLNLIDLGCGTGNFVHVLTKSNIKFKSYIGYDFAVSDKQINACSRIENRSIDSIELASSDNVIICINVLCYLSNPRDISVFNMPSKLTAHLLVTEPYPGLFWDKTFSGISPQYRTPDELISLYQSFGWIHTSTTIEYFLKIGERFIFPLSYTSSFKKD